MEDIKFSIVIPVYNAELFIEKCLESVRQQEYKNYEVILVNDGSTDNSEAVITSYKEHYSEMLIKYVYQENQGPAAARGNGIVLTEGSYIAFLDADDIWYPNKLLVNYQYIKKTGGTFFYSDEYEVMPDGSKRRSAFRQLGANPMVELITEGNPISTSTVVAEQKLLLGAHTFFDGKRVGEDIACWISLAGAGAKFIHIPEILGEYRRNEKSLTMDDEGYLKDTYDRMLSFYDILKGYDFTEEEIDKLKIKQQAKNEYSMARFYHRKKDFSKAKACYLNSLRLNKNNGKAKTGYALAVLKIRK